MTKITYVTEKYKQQCMAWVGHVQAGAAAQDIARCANKKTHADAKAAWVRKSKANIAEMLGEVVGPSNDKMTKICKKHDRGIFKKWKDSIISNV